MIDTYDFLFKSFFRIQALSLAWIDTICRSSRCASLRTYPQTNIVSRYFVSAPFTLFYLFLINLPAHHIVTSSSHHHEVVQIISNQFRLPSTQPVLPSSPFISSLHLNISPLLVPRFPRLSSPSSLQITPFFNRPFNSLRITSQLFCQPASHLQNTVR